MEQLIRLQHENERLRAQVSGSSDEQVAQMKSLLEDAQGRKEKLEVENRQQSLRIVELESEVSSSKSVLGKLKRRTCFRRLSLTLTRCRV
jgi:hypothetical protein